MIQSFKEFDAGYTLHPEISVLQKGSLKKIPFPAKVSVLEHNKHGIILFDTGYSAQFNECTKRFPESIYRWLTPVTIDETQICLFQLKNLGISPEDVKYIIVSHFHADHIGGLRDFPNAKFIFAEDGLRTLKLKGRFKKTLQGFIPQFLPDDFLARSRILKQDELKLTDLQLQHFHSGWDVFSDGSVWAIPLPGHAPGHIGIYFEYRNENNFCISDAAWTQKSIIHDTLPSWIALKLMDSNADYQKTLYNIHDLFMANRFSLRPLNIIPCHCSKIICHE